MMRRLLAQLGLTALLVALGAGAVFADSPSAPTTPASDPGQTVVSTDTSSVVVDTNHSTTTTIGPSGDSNSSDPTATPPSGNAPSGPGSSSLTPPSSGSGNGSAGPGSSTTNNLGTGTGDDATVSPTHPATTTTQPSTPASTLVATAASHNGFVAGIERAAFISGLNPVEPVLATTIVAGLTHHVPPAPPASPVGLLFQLHILLISTLVPATRFVYTVAAGAANSHAGLAVAFILVLASLLSLMRAIPANSYTARLRRSGFLGAARSDVSAALLTFATPREMSSIGAVAPG
jgi:hypothetical protein